MSASCASDDIVECVCDKCGETYERKKRHADMSDRNFCSEDCLSDAYREEYSEEYHNKEVLNNWVNEKGAEISEIAEYYDVTKSCIKMHLRENDIDWRSRECYYKVAPNGYPKIYNTGNVVTEHQLVALSKGYDPYKIFGQNEWSVDHKNGCKLDNRPENLELMTVVEHGKKDAIRGNTGYSHQDLLTVVNEVMSGEPDKTIDLPGADVEVSIPQLKKAVSVSANQTGQDNE